MENRNCHVQALLSLLGGSLDVSMGVFLTNVNQENFSSYLKFYNGVFLHFNQHDPYVML